jgi:hypothetical protein
MMMSLRVITLMAASLLQSAGSSTTRSSAETPKKEQEFAALKKDGRVAGPLLHIFERL